jgi:uncharacterized protein (DUF1778 family)
MDEQAPQVTMVYKLAPEVYDQFVADLDVPCLGSQFEKIAKLFERQSPFSSDCD